MSNKIFNFVFFVFLLLLQSCSGGKIGNFLESSFNNNSNKIPTIDINKKSESSIISKDKILIKEKDETAQIKPYDDNKTLNIINSLPATKDDANITKKRNQIYNPKSYRVFVILKKVDPSFPTENFSKVLRNGDINFEIEKIELITDSNQNKK